MSAYGSPDPYGRYDRYEPGPYEPYEPGPYEPGFEGDPQPPRHRRGTRLAVLAGVAVAALLLVGATAFGGSILLSGSGKGDDAGKSSVAGDVTGDPTSAPGEPTPEATSDAPTTAAPSKPAQVTTPPTKPKTTGAPLSGNAAYEAEVLVIVNKERAKAGCRPLAYNAKLTTAARKHSADMAARDYFSHTTPEGVDFAKRITAAGYQWSGAAENIAKGQRTPADVMNAWMNSSGHRANILNCGLKDLGVGLAYQGRTPIWTQDFGSPR